MPVPCAALIPLRLGALSDVRASTTPLTSAQTSPSPLLSIYMTLIYFICETIIGVHRIVIVQL